MNIKELFENIYQEEQKTNGTYASLLPTEETKKKLNQILSEYVDDPLDVEKLHVTVLYSSKEIDVEYGEFALDEAVEAVVEEIHPLGDEGAVVMRLSFPYAEEKFKEYMDMGGKHDYEEYIPHMTISYNSKILEDGVGDIPVLKFDRLNISELDLDWKKTNDIE